MDLPSQDDIAKHAETWAVWFYSWEENVNEEEREIAIEGFISGATWLKNWLSKK